MTDGTPFDGVPVNVRSRLRKSTQPGWVAPMLATLTGERFSREGWLFEPKWDGERCLVFRSDQKIRLFSRNRKPLNERYPEIVEAFRRQKAHSFIVDGEVVTFEDGVTSFAKLQQRMQVEEASPDLIRSVPVSLYLFDLLYVGVYDTRAVPLLYRKEVLQRTFDFRDALRFTEHRETEGEAYWRAACRRGWEGVIAKDGESAYISGRTRDWLKFKCLKEQELVIGGYTDPQGGRTGFGALLLGFYRQGRLVYAGKVGTGFDRETLKRLRKQLVQIETVACPFEADGLPRKGVHWTAPKLVAQVAFTEWTPENKLRHPRFLGLRGDKDPKDVVRES